MQNSSKLAKNTIIYFIGSFGSRLLTFILLPVYSNYLTQDQYGSYDLINTIIQICYPVITLMFDNAVYVYLIGADDKKHQNELISCSVRTLLFNGLFSIVFCIAINFIYPIEYIVLVIVWLFTISAYNIWTQICRGLKFAKLYSITGVVVTAITLFGNIIGLVFLNMDYQILMISTILGLLSAVIIIELKLHIISTTIKTKKNKILKKELLRYTIPLLPNQLSWWIINASDRIMLSWMWGTSVNGLYAMSCKIPSLLIIFHNIFNMAWSDEILSSKDIKETEKKTVGLFNSYIQISVGISIILICSNKFIFEYIIGGNFVDGYKYTYFLYIANVFNAMASCLGSYYGYFKKSFNVGISTIIAAVFNFGINIIFMKKFGIQVASISTLVGFIIMFIIRIVGLNGLVKIKFYNKTKIVFLIFIPLYFVTIINGFVANLILIIIGLIIACLINYNNIKLLLKNVIRIRK